MESYRSFLAGWVRYKLVKCITNLDVSKKVIMVAKVRDLIAVMVEFNTCVY